MAKECSNSSCSKESCEGCPSKAGQGKPDFHIDLNADSSINHVIGVVRRILHCIATSSLLSCC